MRVSILGSALCFALLSGNVMGQCCDHTLAMQDSYGDGWNGGALQVRINGVLIGTFGASGSGSISSFEACNGDLIQLTYTSGAWEEENTYQLYGPAGNVLFAAGPNPPVGQVWSGSTDCNATVAAGSVPCAALPIDTANCVLVNNSGVQGSGISAGCANYQGGDLWYGMLVPPSGTVVINTQDVGGLNDTGIALWTGPNCFSLSRWACDDDSGDGYFSRIYMQELVPGNLLLIQVFGYGGASGAFELCVADPGTIEVESSELPIMLINTNGQGIPFQGRITAQMELKYAGPGNLTYLNGPSNEYNGQITIGVRGASSSGYPQRPYKLETRNFFGQNNNVPLLGMPAENDWVLLSNYNDRSMVRNALAFHLARSMGQYAPRVHLCEVILNGNYRGIYTFGEKIKRDNGRVNIATLNFNEVSGDDLTGGYILHQNLRGANNSFQSNFSPIDHPGLDVHFLYEYPTAGDIVAQQRAYIASFIDSLETALYSPAFADPEIGYRRYLDVPSFINYFLVNEVARNNDGFKKSVFFHKDKNSNGGKLKAGPVWDFDWAWKNINECNVVQGPNGSGWSHRINDCPTDNHSTGWMIRLLQDSAFTTELRCTYEYERMNSLSEASINAFIDSVGTLVQNAQVRHFQKWPILGMSGPAPESGPFGATHAEDLMRLKQWIAIRLAWLDNNIPGVCSGVGVADAAPMDALRVYAEAGTGRVSFVGTWGAGNHQLLIHDMAGREVRRIPIVQGSGIVDLYLDRSGTYVYNLLRDGAVVTRGKLVVVM
ncbi:MAG: CotH kinase family protein [Flavobacteriales bacterium]|nr:CotH kinase family protein [Flavobacteriales bacterium]